MGSFNYIDTFFFISLGITFVLILLLVFHFKQRMAVLEEKTDTMFEIVNNVVKEIITVKNVVYHTMPIHNTEYLDPNIRSVPIINETIRFDNDNNKIPDVDQGEEEDDEDSESDEEDDDEDSESDEEDGEDSVSDEDESEDDNGEEQEQQIKLVNVDLQEVEPPHLEAVEEILIEKVTSDEIPSVDAETQKESAMDVYRKMSLSELKKLLITKGLSSDPSKMKKYDILKMLENNFDQ